MCPCLCDWEKCSSVLPWRPCSPCRVALPGVPSRDVLRCWRHRVHPLSCGQQLSVALPAARPLCAREAQQRGPSAVHVLPAWFPMPCCLRPAAALPVWDVQWGGCHQLHWLSCRTQLLRTPALSCGLSPRLLLAWLHHQLHPLPPWPLLPHCHCRASRMRGGDVQVQWMRS